jgi:glutathione S-transferase
VLEIDNNVKIAQSQAILRYLGKKFNLAGKDDVEAAIVDSLGYLFIDFHIAIRPFARCVAGYEQGDLVYLFISLYY